MKVILLIEDEEPVRRSLERLIQRRGYEIASAEHGQAALDLLDTMEDAPCVILLDLMMPVMDGWTFLEQLLRRPGGAAIPVVLLSGVADLDRQAQVTDAVEALRKPVDLERLYTVIDGYCRCA